MSDSLDQIGQKIQQGAATAEVAAQVVEAVAPLVTAVNPALGAEVAAGAQTATGLIEAGKAANAERKTGAFAALFAKIKALFS
jgi:hypothetical protein